MLSKYTFSQVYDLQNSSRTTFYRKYLFNINNWSSTDTTLKKGEKKSDFDKESVLERFKIQLANSNVKTDFTLKPDFTWAAINIDKIINKYFGKKFILLFPFCSPQLPHKKWPYFNELVKIIKSKHANLEIAIAPAFNEIEETKKIDTACIMNNEQPLSIIELAGLILKSSYVIANDTGPAHMAAHLNKSGITIFGPHTTAKKVSIETKKFRAISADSLKDLSVEKVYMSIKNELELID